MKRQKSIYLDYNIFAYYFDGAIEGLNRKVNDVKGVYKLPYSPAHIEEIAVPLMLEKSERDHSKDAYLLAIKKLKNISHITGNLELFPGSSSPIVEKFELPHKCLERVICHYDRNPILENQEENLLSRYKANDENGEKSQKISNLPNDILLRREFEGKLKLKLHFDLLAAGEARKLGLMDFKWPDIAKSHHLIERCIELAMNYIEEIRYKPEKIKKHRSRMHDVSHSIYATSTDYLVSSDERFVHKTRAVYIYFGIPTKVLTLNEFLSSDEFDQNA